MTGKLRVAIACLALCAVPALAQAKSTSKRGTAIDGTWRVNGTVTVAKHIKHVSVGDKFTRTWTITSTCTGTKGKCKATMSYHVSGGSAIRVPLKQSGKSYSGTLANRSFSCDNGTTGTGSLSFKLRVTSFTTHKQRKVARAVSATGIQAGTCPGANGSSAFKEVVKFSFTREGF